MSSSQSTALARKTHHPAQRPLILALSLVLAALAAPRAHAAPFDIAQVPIYLGGVIEPNLMYIHDDSGSMGWAYLPDTISGTSTTKRGTSSAFNRQYYNPSITYPPAVDSLNVSRGNASFTAAWSNGYDTNRGANLVNLSTAYRVSWSAFDSFVTAAEPAFYHVYDVTLGGCPPAALTKEACYRKVVVSATSGPGATDERQNFANWYSYYRTRNFAAKGGISRAFASLGEGIRIGYGRINKGATVIDGRSVAAVERGVRPFRDEADATKKYRKQFFDWLFAVGNNSGTPLRRALDGAGQYFENVADTGPWSTTPGDAGGSFLACRKSFTVLMTDGYWNSDEALTAGARANNDGTNGNVISGQKGESYAYTARSPFSDTHTNTLADVAMHYWKRDLAPGIRNQVPTSVLNPAFWQHMVTYGVSFGLVGNQNPTAVFNAITDDQAAAVTWGNPVGAADDDPSKIDDLLHAAVNSRGGFYSASDPDEFAKVMSAALAKIRDETSSAAQVAATGTQLNTGATIYQATFQSDNWTSKFLAFKVYTRKDRDDGLIPTGFSIGDIAPTPTWDAAEKVPAQANRKIFSWDPVAKVSTNFTWDTTNGISTAQRVLLDNSSALLSYLRGDKTNEAPNGNKYRVRDSKLGDIINSDPWFVGTGDFGYATATSDKISDAQRAAYRARKVSTTFKERPPVVYVGANDGMLHAFDATTGDERFAYVPNAVFPNLKKLAATNYAHSYFVDGSPRAADALIGNVWKTVLVGSTGAGGRSYFALDVENPRTAAISKSMVLWEFADADLGATIGQASIVLTEAGKWVAIFGNGYNSDNHRAMLYVVDLETGQQLAKIDTKVGDAANPNGLSTPLAVDADRNGAVDLVYAGDMHGNLWKFDFTGASAGAWKSAFSSGSTPKPLFTAKDKDGKAQPISSKVQAARHPYRNGMMIFFGTGKFFEVGDQGNLDAQSFYGVIDGCGRDGTSCTSQLTRSNLVEQTIELEQTTTFGTLTWPIRVLSNKEVPSDKHGYFLDLISPVMGKEGERIISPPLVWGDRVIYTTMIPDSDPCNFGGTSWIMEVDPFTGGRLTFTVFDLNGDGSYDDKEYVTLNGQRVPVSGRKTEGGMTKTPIVIEGNKYVSGTSGGKPELVRQKPSGDLGRQSWRQIR